VQQGGIDASEPGDHVGVGLVAFAGAGENGAEFARIGNEHLVPERLKESAIPRRGMDRSAATCSKGVAAVGRQTSNPRTVGSHLHGEAGLGILDGKPPERIAMIGNGALFNDLALFIENTNGVGLVPEVDTDGDVWNDVFHNGSKCITALKRRQLPSHLILFALFGF